MIKYRLAIKEDVDLYYNWAIEKGVRSNSLNQSDIHYEDHCYWFKNKLDSEDSYLFIFFIGESPLGQVRFDVHDCNALIDYSIDFNFRGKGFGSRVLQKAINDFLSKKNISLVAKVDDTNIASKKVFQKLNFNSIGKEEIKSRIINVYKLNMTC